MDVTHDKGTSQFLMAMKLKNITVMCYRKRDVISRGIFLGDDPLRYMDQLFLCQLSLISFFTGALRFILMPLGQTSVVIQIVGGLLMGPSGFGAFSGFQKRFFPLQSVYVLDTLGPFGCVIFLFLTGVKMDILLIKRSGIKEWSIGFFLYILPIIFTLPMSVFLKRFTMDDQLKTILPLIAMMESMTSFHVTTCLLADLKLLNSELGHLAVSSSTISAIFTSITVVIVTSLKRSPVDKPGVCLLIISSVIALVIIIIFILRPIVIWIIRQIPEGKPIKEIYLFVIFLMILGCSLLGQTFGLHPSFGAIVLGMAIPNGPPLGTALVEKFDCFLSGLIIPLYFMAIGGKTKIKLIRPNTLWIITLLSFLGFLGKLIGAMVPALYCKMPLQDAVALGLLLSSIGLVDFQFYYAGRENQIISHEHFAILIVWAMFLNAVISPLVRLIYNPSSRYLAYKKRTIQHTKQNAELCILVCIYNQENVPTIINLLEASNPTRERPIGVYVLHLIELLGRVSPLLVTHQPYKNITSHSTRSDHIINAFRIYEQHNQGIVTVQPFTAFSPFATVHDDICTIASDRKVSLVIIPFHKQWSINGTVESAKCRNINNNVLNKAPCSVGILLDRGILNGTRSVLGGGSFYRVGVIFLGGADDRETLAYATRMAENPNINVTVVRILAIDNKSSDVMERRLDSNMINDFRLNNVGSERNVYREVVVTDGLGTLSVIQSMENSYDLIMTGKHQESSSPLLSGLAEWNEFPELGFVGDMLASSDFKGNVSVLVVHQCAYGPDLISDGY